MKKIITAVLLLIFVVSLVSCDELDKSELERAMAVKVNAADYTEESYERYKEKYEAAVLEYNNTATTEAKISRAASELNSAINALVKRADFTVLEEILKAEYSPEKYTTESYQQYREVYKLATEVLNNKNSRQSSVNSAVKKLRDTINALVPLADTNELEEVIADLINQGNYTSASYNRYKELYDAAKNLLERVQTTDDENEIADLKADIQLCVAQLKLAKSQLVERGNTSDLETKYSNAFSVYNGSVDGVSAQAYYSEASYTALGTALENAKNIIESGDYDQTEIDKCGAVLESAVNGLVVRGERNELYALILEAQTKYIVNVDWFTMESFNELNDAVNNAIDLYNSANSTTEQLISAMDMIQDAIDSLEYVIIIGTGRDNFNFSKIIVNYKE